ncbi:type III pantothenate kinase [soil metagenome]
MILLVDVGNSRVKWAVFDGEKLGPMQTGEIPADRLLPARLYKLRRPELVVVCNVAGPLVARTLREEVTQAYDVPVRFAVAAREACGVRNAYADPAQLGADRWAAMIGAFTEHGGPICVVDAGTACTVDVIDREGRHLGGAIAPGINLMISSLRNRTQDIAAFEKAHPGGGAGLLANNTADGLRNGALNALAGLVDRAAGQAESSTGQQLLVALTGGDGERLHDLLLRRTHYNPALVLCGLAKLAAD